MREEELRGFVSSAYGRIVANVRLITGSSEEAEDLVQEALARAWALSERGEEIRSLEAWVAVVALNLARSWLRRMRIERRARVRLERDARWMAGLDPGQELSGELPDIRQAVSRLPRRQREVVILRYYLDLEIAEVARSLGVSEGTAKKALHRARVALGGSLENRRVTNLTGGRARATGR